MSIHSDKTIKKGGINNMKITKKNVLCFILLLSFCLIQVAGVLYIPKANAENLWEKQQGMTGGGSVGEAFGEPNPDSDYDIRIIIINIVKIFLGLLGIIFMVLMIVAGYKWMTAGGNEEKVKEAKSQIKTAIIGLVIIFMAYSIARFVTRYIYEATEATG
jgi:hypothetical protein